jgi:hypothetical protein
MERKDIFQQIENVFAKHKLIGNKDFSEDEYSLMVDSVGVMCSKFISDKHYQFDKMDYKLIFVTLVEIVKRWKEYDFFEDNEENSGFWLYVFKILSGKDEFDQRLYSEFTYVISQMELQNLLPVVKIGKKYYATLMMHSFAPKNSIFSFFDLCYNVFRKDLEFGFTHDDEWLCEKVASEMKTVLGGGYREEKKVSIGSSAYSIKIGLRSFALNEDLSDDFIEFIKDTFYQINKLFNRDKIDGNTRLDRYVTEWWKNKIEFEKFSDDAISKKRVATVSKQDIIAKYIKSDNEVFLCIPPIRLDESDSTMWLTVYVNGKQAYSEEMRTKRGELVVATKLVEFELNELLRYDNSINVRIKIKENQTVIFDSEKNKATLLNREFLLFEGEKEILSQINKPTNYFVYSKNIDALKSTPDDLTTCGANIYNIYPNAGESLIGETKQVFFVNKEKSASLGKNACLIGSLSGVEWILDDISCVVYRNSVKLMIPENVNLKALELKIDNKSYNLHDINYERIESNCYQFGLKALGLIDECYPTQISLFSYEKETMLLNETVIVLPNLDIQFNKSFYYGDIERKVVIANANESNELSWTNQDNEVIYPIKEGILVIKVPYLKWRLNKKEWRNKSINQKIWYKDLLENGDFLEIDNPNEDEVNLIEGKADGIPFEITKNQSGKFEIGRAIYAKENKQDISICFISRNKEKFELLNIATKEHFVNDPLTYKDGKVLWDVENTFIGDKNNEFFLIAKSKYKDEKSWEKKVGSSNIVFGNFDEDIYKITVKIKDKNIFLGDEKYNTIFEGKLLVGLPEKLRFKGKVLYIDKVSAAFSDTDGRTWIQPYSKYLLKDLEYIDSYYQGNLGVIRDDKIMYLNSMENEKGEWDKINPVRIELRSNNSFWLVAGYDKENNDFLGELIFDNTRRGLCNINSNDSKRYLVVNLYKFKEEEYV